MILTGLALIVVSLTGRMFAPVAIIGSLILVTGLILAVQNAFGVWPASSRACCTVSGVAVAPAFGVVMPLFVIALGFALLAATVLSRHQHRTA